MEWTSYTRLTSCLALIVFMLVFGATPLASAQETEQGLSDDELRSRLERLHEELAAEREACDETRESQELNQKKQKRRRLAGQLLEKRIELERLKEWNETFRKDSKDQNASARHLQGVMNNLLAEVKSSAEILDIYLREIPGKEQRGSEVKRVLHNLPESLTSLDPEAFLQSFRLLINALDLTHREANDLSIQRIRLRTAGGLLEQVKLVSIGHVAFAYEVFNDGRVGLALASPADASGYRWTEKLPDRIAREVQLAIEQLEAGGTKLVTMPMDVTGRLRIDTRPYDESLAGQLVAGGPVMYPLAAVAILALLLIIERFIWLYLRNADRALLIQRILALCGERRYEEAERSVRRASGVVLRTLAVCLRSRRLGARAMEDTIQEQLLHELPRLRRFLSGLAVFAAVAPLLGLLGTVTGIIDTFGVIRAFGNANPSFMAGGISEALITTATGLIIAIPILLFRAMLQGRMDKVLGDAERHAATLLNTLSKDK